MRKRVLSLSIASGVMVFALVIAPAYAHADDETPVHKERDSAALHERAEQKKQHLEAATTRSKERLEAAKLKICEQREKRINAIMARKVTQAEKHIEVFSKITERVKAFYVAKGNTAANYDALVAAVDAAKAEAEASILVLKDTDNFVCDSEDPKATAGAFKAAHESLREDLKAYRTAVKNLIVAVKTAQGGSDEN